MTDIARAIAHVPEDVLEAVIAERSRRSLTIFFKYAWPYAVPKPLYWAFYCEALADHLAAVYRKEIRRLLINLPFRTAKSTFVSVLFPAWCWLHDPGMRIFSATHTQSYAERDCWATRKLMRTDWYRRMITDPVTGKTSWEFAGDQNEKGRYYNDQSGFRIATHVGGGTGEGGDLNVVDDPHTTDQAKSPVERENAVIWFFGTFYSRQNSPTETRLVVLQQRQHPEDLSGKIMKADLGFEVLHIPLEFRPEMKRPPTVLGWEDPRTQRDEVIDPKRWTPPAVAELRKAMSYDPGDWEAQANQNPIAASAVVVRPEWVKRWGTVHALPTRFERLIQTWDCALKGKEKDKPEAKVRRSYVVGLLLGFISGRCYVLDLERGQWDLVDTIDAIRRMTKRWPSAVEKYIEDEANGPAVISSLKGEIGGMIPVQPKGSKYARMVSTQPFWRAGNIFLPEDDAASWVRDFFSEITSFPNATNDDQCDALSQGITQVWHVGSFDFSFGPGEAPVTAGSSIAVTGETARAVVALHGSLITVCRELMSAPAKARPDRFWGRWGLIGGSYALDTLRTEAVVQTSSSAEDLAIAIVALAFNLEIETIRPLVERAAAMPAAPTSPVAQALANLGMRMP